MEALPRHPQHPSPYPHQIVEDQSLQPAKLAAAAAMQLDPALMDMDQLPASTTVSGVGNADDGEEQWINDVHADSAVENDDNDARNEQWRSNRRAHLIKEAEMMRAALSAKEREIDELR